MLSRFAEMKRLYLLFFLAGSLALFQSGCDATGDDAGDPSGVFSVSGYVVDASTGDPLVDAVVEIEPTDLPPIRTDDEGFYDADVEIDSTLNITVSARKTNYVARTQEVVALAGESEEITLRLTSTSVERESGTPSNITLQSQSRDQIGIIGSGAPEVTSVTFQVTDSAGVPVTLTNDALVSFSLSQGPGGGEFIAPQQARTNDAGNVKVNLSSGTAAGVVQIKASFERPDGTVIQSNPISITIHGGHPDAEHFTLGPAQYNFPGLFKAGTTNPISVIVGDEFGNPVRPGTAVYFTTSHGVIEGSALTDNQGAGSVSLISAEPYPEANGVAVITAETADKNDQLISEQIPVLFTGLINVSVSPTQASLGTTYQLNVTDELGNPLAGGTSIGVEAEGTAVKAVGHTDVTLDDTAFRDQNGDGDALDAADIVDGNGITDFSFTVVEDADSTETPEVSSIKISVGGPNGSLQCVINTTESTCDAGTVARRGPEGVLLVGEPPSFVK